MEYIKFCVLSAILSAVISLLILIGSIFVRKKTKNKHFVYVMLVLTVFCVIFSCYFSLDLFYKDYVTETGMYMYSHRENFYHSFYFDTGEDKYQGYDVYSDEQLNGLTLIKGELYEYVYAKRTRVLLDIEKIS